MNPRFKVYVGREEKLQNLTNNSKIYGILCKRSRKYCRYFDDEWLK